MAITSASGGSGNLPCNDDGDDDDGDGDDDDDDDDDDEGGRFLPDETIASSSKGLPWYFPPPVHSHAYIAQLVNCMRKCGYCYYSGSNGDNNDDDRLQSNVWVG